MCLIRKSESKRRLEERRTEREQVLVTQLQALSSQRSSMPGTTAVRWQARSILDPLKPAVPYVVRRHRELVEQPSSTPAQGSQHCG